MLLTNMNGIKPEEYENRKRWNRAVNAVVVTKMLEKTVAKQSSQERLIAKKSSQEKLIVKKSKKRVQFKFTEEQESRGAGVPVSLPWVAARQGKPGNVSLSFRNIMVGLARIDDL